MRPKWEESLKLPQVRHLQSLFSNLRRRMPVLDPAFFTSHVFFLYEPNDLSRTHCSKRISSKPHSNPRPSGEAHMMPISTVACRGK